MARISIKGVVVGGIVDVASSVALGLPISFYTASKLDLTRIPKDQLGLAVTTAIHADVPLCIGQTVIGLACSVLGGYVAAWLAKRDERVNGGLSSFLCLALGIFTILSGKDPSPLPVQILLLVAGPLFALLGGDLMRRQRWKRPATA